jgi:hypothetical protein
MDIIIDSTDDDSTDDESIDAFDDYYSLESIYNINREQINSEKINGQYYIGNYSKCSECNVECNDPILILANVISPATFFNYNVYILIRYLSLYSIIYTNTKKIDIMKLHILPDGTYSTIIKTHWIRLIQRHWRSVLLKRDAILKIRMQLNSIKNSQLFPSAKCIPTLRGMLSQYASICQTSINIKID